MNYEPDPILVVEDNEMNRDMLSRRLIQQGYTVVAAQDGQEALGMLAERRFALVLLDIMMPKVDGYQVLERMRCDQGLRHVPVIMITALDDMDSAAHCIQMGAEDYLPKPFNPVLLKARVQACLDKKRFRDQQEDYQRWLQEQKGALEERVREQVSEIAAAQQAAIFAMSKLAESKDPETGAHLERMRESCRIISEQLAKTEKYLGTIDECFVETIYAASPLHDIGKVGVPDEVLLKPGKLDAQEWTLMKTHTTIGAETLRAVHAQHPGNDFIEMGIDIAQSHHEKWDGSGYPNGLVGEDIPLAARILPLGDVYDALTSRRCYKEAYTHQKSRNIIHEGSGNHFDPMVVEAFLETEDEFIRIREYFGDPDN